MTYKEKVLTAALCRCAKVLIREIRGTGEVMSAADYNRVIIAMNTCLTDARAHLGDRLSELELANRCYEDKGGRDISEFGGTSE